MTYLASDLDGTFIPLKGEIASQQALEVLSRAYEMNTLELVYVTGRHFDSVMSAIEEHALPMPKWILCDVGSSIYQLAEDGFEIVEDYRRQLDSIVEGVDVEQLRQNLIHHVPGLRLQESFKQGPHKLSYYADASNIDEITEHLESYLESQSAPYGVVSSIDPFNGDGLIDVMPRRVSKAYALSWWCEYHSIRPEEVVFAGDSGNDYAALSAGHRAILVSNADRSIAKRLRVDHELNGWSERLFLATQPSTAGVLAGAAWFGLIGESLLPESDPATLPVTQLHRYLGATPLSDSLTRFCVWAPRHERLEIKNASSDMTHSLSKCESGYHMGSIDGFAAGDLYYVQIPNGPARPDPASRFQPQGVHGPSQIIDRQFAWTDSQWNGVRRDDLVIYELHIGALTEEGTFQSAIERLDELVELGITAIEVMPPNETAGRWNWGYDGVNLFAPRHSYGSPDDLRSLVDAAHAKGLAVIVDVVYNHFGPEGNYLGDFASYISRLHTTVWGAAPNLDQLPDATEMRRFLIANAIHWLDEYHIDGLRVDAIHCIRDNSEPHWVAELSDAVRRWGQRYGRHPLLIAESNVYDPEMTIPASDGGYDFDGAWCDCFLHSVFGVVRPGEQLSNRVYKPTDLKRVLHQGYVFDGTIRRARQRRELEHRVDTHGLVYSIQNHDFIGNHPLGRRLHQLTSVATQRAAAALLILSPAIPMLFMGEEFCCEQPFGFFVDFSDEALRQGVVAGRRAEYPQHDWTHAALPIDPEAFTQSRIGPITEGDPATWDWYQSLIRLRKQMRSIGLLADRCLASHSDVERGLYVLRYEDQGEQVTVAVRLSPDPNACDAVELDDVAGQILLDSRAETSPAETPDRSLLANHAKVFTTNRGDSFGAKHA